MKWLSNGYDHRDKQYASRDTVRAADSGKWLLSHTSFQQWFNSSPGGAILWLYGLGLYLLNYLLGGVKYQG